LARHAWIQLRDDEFTKDGKVIRFQRAALTELGASSNSQALERLWVTAPTVKARASKSATPRKSSLNAAHGDMPPNTDALLVQRLRAFRLETSRSQGIPAFRVLTDRALYSLAAEQPRNFAELMAISGIGKTIVQKYGNALLAIINQAHD
jgi:superfamily II DNA helicase RecQ